MERMARDEGSAWSIGRSDSRSHGRMHIASRERHIDGSRVAQSEQPRRRHCGLLGAPEGGIHPGSPGHRGNHHAGETITSSLDLLRSTCIGRGTRRLDYRRVRRCDQRTSKRGHPSTHDACADHARPVGTSREGASTCVLTYDVGAGVDQGAGRPHTSAITRLGPPVPPFTLGPARIRVAPLAGRVPRLARHSTPQRPLPSQG